MSPYVRGSLSPHRSCTVYGHNVMWICFYMLNLNTNDNNMKDMRHSVGILQWALFFHCYSGLLLTELNTTDCRLVCWVFYRLYHLVLSVVQHKTSHDKHAGGQNSAWRPQAGPQGSGLVEWTDPLAKLLWRPPLVVSTHTTHHDREDSRTFCLQKCSVEVY